jgi:2-(1,2-epoxy-1,2-dihydrophenyl)acetyl-CoA isomerase
LVAVEIDDSLATLTLRRPDARNALTLQMKQDFLAALHQVHDSKHVRAVLLRADGPAFCVGQDLAEHAEALVTDADSALDTVRVHYNRIVAGITAIDVPVVVEIAGACVGAGLGFALAGDIRLAAEDATFVTAFTAIGLASDSGLARALARTVGVGRATDLLLRGERFDAVQAHAWGLVQQVVPAAEVRRVAAEVAGQLAAGPTLAYTQVKHLLRDVTTQDLATALEREATAQERLARTADHRGAVEAFLAKQPPRFAGA